MHGIVIFSWVSLRICSCKTTRTFPILFWLVITVSWSDKEKEDDMNVYFVHCRLCSGVGNFNLALLGWRIWLGNFKSFQRNKRISTFNMEVFKSEKITFASRWLSRNGLQESPWYKSCLYNKNDHKIQRLGGAFEADFAPGARTWTN